MPRSTGEGGHPHLYGTDAIAPTDRGVGGGNTRMTTLHLSSIWISDRRESVKGLRRPEDTTAADFVALYSCGSDLRVADEEVA